MLEKPTTAPGKGKGVKVAEDTRAKQGGRQLRGTDAGAGAAHKRERRYLAYDFEMLAPAKRRTTPRAMVSVVTRPTPFSSYTSSPTLAEFAPVPTCAR
eukprot:5726387-Prymnesium_polylepis.1